MHKLLRNYPPQFGEAIAKLVSTQPNSDPYTQLTPIHDADYVDGWHTYNKPVR